MTKPCASCGQLEIMRQGYCRFTVGRKTLKVCQSCARQFLERQAEAYRLAKGGASAG